VTLIFDLLTPKINGFPGLMVEHFCVKFGYPSCSDFLRYRVDKQTDRQTDTEAPAYGKTHTSAT